MMKQTSVLVNTHNHAPYIRACIDSVLAQTHPVDEIIVYDDASSDDTVAILKEYVERGQIHLIVGRQSSGPACEKQAHAIATAFAECRGRLVFMLDGDDAFAPQKVQRYLACFDLNPDASLIQAPMEKIDAQNRPLGETYQEFKHVTQHLTQIYRRQDVDFYYPTSALAFSYFYLERVLPLDFSDGHALWADTRLAIIAPYFGRVMTLREPLTYWRRHPGSDSLNARSRGLQLRQTKLRTSVFNAFCRRHHLRTISVWRNLRFYRQLVRYCLPDNAFHHYYRFIRSSCKS